VLLVLRAHEPQAGRWTVPGGHVEPDESLQDAARREAYEETGLDVVVGAELGVVEIPYGDDLLEVHDFAAEVVGGTLGAGDDAADVGWFSVEQLGEVPLTIGLLEAFETYGVRVG
jgi:8-oxo-dGTP diphosphatase